VNLSIRYLTEYAYDADVVDNLNSLRVKPAANARQRCDEFSVRLSPDVRVHRHVDYFGTEVVEFEVARPHRRLVIDVRARVATAPAPEPPRAPWADLRSASYREAAGEFLLHTDDASGHPLLASLVSPAQASADPLSAVLQVIEAIPSRLHYRPGVTVVDSSVAHVLDVGAGVCQDFVHVGLAVLRELGIAARYVSGYLFAAAAGGDGSAESVEVDTHAWLEALLPAADGPVWVGADPTNKHLAGETHVKIGHGRQYADVPPIKGVYRGEASSELSARVTMTRLEGLDPASAARS
jgi:transglutaminase-like putative cysteine protease